MTSYPNLICIHFAIPESPRWLITKHKYNELNNLVKKIAKMNKVQISKDLEVSLSEAIANEPENKSSFFTLLNHLIVLRRKLLQNLVRQIQSFSSSLTPF